MAKKFADAHEADSADSQLQIDRAFHNNEVGRNIGSQGGSDADWAAAVLDALYNEKLDTPFGG